MNAKDLTRNKGLFAIILGVAAIAATGGLTAVYAATNSTQTPTQTQPQIQGSINLQQNILSSAKVSFSDAQATAASAVTNGKVIGGSLTEIQGSLVYAFKVVDDKNLVYSVIIDAGNGKVLNTSQGRAMNFGFGMGHFGGGNCPMNGHAGWNRNAAPQTSNPTTTPSANSNPTAGQVNTSTESQM